MITVEEFQKLKDQLESAKRQRDMAAGALDEALKILKQRYKCSTVEEAEALLAKLKEREARLLKSLASMEKKFQDKWQHILEQL